MLTLARFLLAASLVAGTASCGAGDGGGPTAACTKVELVAEPVTGMSKENVRLAARLTAGGRPLEGHEVRLALRVTEQSALIWSQGARTGADGRVVADFADSIRRLRRAQRAFDQAKIFQVDYFNPAEEGDVPPPGWCSTSARVPFEPRR